MSFCLFKIILSMCYDNMRLLLQMIYLSLDNKLNLRAFRLVAIYDLFEDGRINDVNVNFFTLMYITNRFHVAVRLFSNRSQKTSKSGKIISDTLAPIGSCATFLFLPNFYVICDLLLDRRTATWNLFVNLFTIST